MKELVITEHGRKRVESEDFAKSFVHVLDSAEKSGEMAFMMAATYVAANLIVDENLVVWLPGKNEAKLLTDFMNKNDSIIRETIKKVIGSPAFLLHLIEITGEIPDGVFASA